MKNCVVAVLGVLCATHSFTEVTSTPVAITSDAICTLTQDPAVKPIPSLTQCYKYNTESCCVAGHDEKIKREYQNLLSSTCLREFPNLELYYCFGCNPLQQEYIGKDERGLPTIRICESFAEQLFAGSYEKCGLNLPVRNTDATVGNPAAPWNFNYEMTDSRQVVMPKKVFSNHTALLNAMKPPYFEGYTIEVVNNGSCFSNHGTKLAFGLYQVALVFLSTLYLSSY